VEVDQITPHLVNQMLKAWRRGQEPPRELLDLDLLQAGQSGSAVERQFQLQDWISTATTEELTIQRRAEGLPLLDETAVIREDILNSLTGDFASGNIELQAWSALYHRFLCPIPLSVDDLAAGIPTDPRHFRRRLNLGVQRLTARLQRAELAAHEQLHAQQRGRHLPPPEYTRLFGVSTLRNHISALLRDADGPLFLSIEGLGGIGKTALARAVAFELAQESGFENIFWISARQSSLTERGTIAQTAGSSTTLADILTNLTAQIGLEQLVGLSEKEKLQTLEIYLHGHRNLIVVDNLESISDIDALLPAFSPLAGPARFLLTSRQAMSKYPYVSRVAVPQLSIEESQALFEAELLRHGRLQGVTQAHMATLYQLVGGMPLALKLIAAQAGHWPLDRLLQDMSVAEQGPSEQLYTYIYRRAWLALDDEARGLLLSMLTISPDGEDVEWLKLLSALSPDVFDRALRQLLDYSLIETAGDLSAPTYRLHRLTITFLQTEIIQSWSDGPERKTGQVPNSSDGSLT
jgi:hypothetical protein